MDMFVLSTCVACYCGESSVSLYSVQSELDMRVVRDDCLMTNMRKDTSLLLLHFLSHCDIRNKAIETVLRRRENHIGNLRMEMQLLDGRLTLPMIPDLLRYRMDEQELRRNVLLLIRRLCLQRQVPYGELVVARDCQHRRVVRTPLHRRDRSVQVAEVSHRAAPTSHCSLSPTGCCGSPTRGRCRRRCPKPAGSPPGGSS